MDSAGRNWTAPSYAEMAVRTAAQNAGRQGHTDKLTASGYDLVIISSHMPTCELCYPWQNKVLSLNGATNDYPTLFEAQDAGLYHPNCGHSQTLFTPGLTEEPPKLTAEEAAAHKQANNEQYGAIQTQRKLERGLRQWKRREAVAITPEAEQKAKAKVKEWRGALNEHVDTTNAAYRAKYGKDVFGNDVQLVYRQSWREADKVTTQAEKDTGAKARRLVVSGRIQDEIKAGKYITDVKPQQQKKHIEGTREFLKAQADGKNKSYFEGATLKDVQSFVKTNAGSGIIAMKTPASEYPVEIVRITGLTGKTWDGKNGKYIDTDIAEIKYSSKGVHIFPVSKTKGII